MEIRKPIRSQKYIRNFLSFFRVTKVDLQPISRINDNESLKKSAFRVKFYKRDKLSIRKNANTVQWGKSMKILIVDDSTTMRMILVKSLRQAGFDSATVLEASSARDALQKIAAGGIDIVLCDVNMPEITGIEMVKVVKTKMPGMPIVMVTTESSPEMKLKMMEAGANGIVTKPFPPEELKNVLTPLLPSQS